MSRETRQSVKLVLVVAAVVAVLTALAWWSVVGLVFVVLAALVGLAVGWTLGYQHALKEIEQAQPARRRRTGAGKTGGTKR
ncbi:MAG TPA: hypothetical protein VKT82_08500 [Ktedonobacterales bacterium]|nr:hypothetical protein [Ktedonobacterales bacterium]